MKSLCLALSLFLMGASVQASDGTYPSENRLGEGEMATFSTALTIALREKDLNKCNTEHVRKVEVQDVLRVAGKNNYYHTMYYFPSSQPLVIVMAYHNYGPDLLEIQFTTNEARTEITGVFLVERSIDYVERNKGTIDNPDFFTDKVVETQSEEHCYKELL